jgi:hypothetical protein
MIKRIFVSSILVVILFCSGASFGQALGNGCGRNEKSENSGEGISVDQDANVWLVGFGHRQKVGQDLRGKAGQIMPLEFVPRSDVPVQQEQLTCKIKDWKIVALLTIAPQIVDSRQTFDSRLTIVLFHGSRAKLLFQKRYPAVYRMVIADVNGDGMPELAVQWTDAALISPAFSLDLWSIDSSGNLARIDLKNISSGMNLPLASHSTLVELGNYDVGDFSVYSEQKAAEKDGVVLKVRKQYLWNQKKAEYEFKSTIKIEERMVAKE